MNQGNTVLVNHGIQTDQSDYRAHVAFHGGRLYIFPTSAGKKVLAPGHRYKEFTASQPGTMVVTGKGYKVPPKDIEGCIEIRIPEDILAGAAFNKADDPSLKGKKAIAVVSEMFRRGLIHVPVQLGEVQDKDLQIRGWDITVRCQFNFQVKCDNWAAEYGLSLQTAECNPFRRY